MGKVNRGDRYYTAKERNLAFLVGFVLCFSINIFVGHYVAAKRSLVAPVLPLHKSRTPESLAHRSPSHTSFPNATIEERSVDDWGIYQSLEELDNRRTRFPSVEQRLQVYLSSWYAPPCNNNTDTLSFEWGINKSFVLLQNIPGSVLKDASVNITASTQHGREVILMEKQMMAACTNRYCQDVAKYYFPSLDRIRGKEIPLLLQFGDAEPFHILTKSAAGHNKKHHYPFVPVLKKFRYAADKNELSRVAQSAKCLERHERTMQNDKNEPPHVQGIITVVSNFQRHFGPLKHVDAADTPWEQKKDMVVWRGSLTGRNHKFIPSNQTALEKCTAIPRCAVVLHYIQSTLVDARIVKPGHNANRLHDEITSLGIHMVGTRMEMASILQYKMVLVLEGNDVSTSLKWALFSESVVLMPTPTCTSWLMEELLEPWHHYVPVKDDLSDVEEMARWVLQHDEEARQIARRGRLWIADLLYHPDSVKENEQVLDETLLRYQSHFRTV